MEESERQRKFELEKLVESETKQKEIDALAKQEEIKKLRPNRKKQRGILN